MSHDGENSYCPVDVTPPELTEAMILATALHGWVGDVTTDPATIDYSGRQAAALVPFDVIDGVPRNPAGRTGRVGRNLGRWGENAAVDAAVVAGAGPDRSILLIRRDDCGLWAIPGGMVEPGEQAPAALVRELREETGVDLAAVTPRVLGRLYVDDPRNTDWAWVCTTVALFPVPARVYAVAGDDAVDARWWRFGSMTDLVEDLAGFGERLYSAHESLLTTVEEAVR